MTQPFLVAKDLTKVYQMGEEKVYALQGVSLTINKGEFVSIMGPSGSGKSTFMNLVGALDVPSSGSLSIDGEEISGMTPDELSDLRSRKIGFVFQQFNLMSRASALENVMLPMRYAKMSRTEAAKRAAECLEMVGLAERMDHLPTQLSGGQQQRVAIARSLANNPEAILADEPTGALDSQTGKDIMALFHQLHKSGITLMLVTHDPGVAAQAEREIHFKDGLVVDTDMIKKEASHG